VDVRLILKRGRENRRVFRLTGDESVIGRAKGSAIRIPSAEVSRAHCRLVIQDGTLIVEDLGSLNGTIVNGTAVRGPTQVHPGDVLQVGPARFRVEYEAPVVEAEQSGFEVVEDKSEAIVEGALEVEESADVELIEEEAAPPVFDIDDVVPNLQVPETDEMRDLLAQLDTPEEAEEKPKKKKKKKG
jgi:pSer/pThr/pTyr-binding forkhead associated (FHA) protein